MPIDMDLSQPLNILESIIAAVVLIGASLLLAAAMKVAFNWVMKSFFD